MEFEAKAVILLIELVTNTHPGKPTSIEVGSRWWTYKRLLRPHQ